MSACVSLTADQLADAVLWLGVLVALAAAAGLLGTLLLEGLFREVGRWLRARRCAKPFRERVEYARDVSVHMRDVHARRVRRLTERLYPFADDDCPF